MHTAVVVGDLSNNRLIIMKAYGDSLYKENNISNNKLKIILNEEGKYLDIYKILNMEYSLNRLDYKSDESFSNFRMLKATNLKEIFYRGASPIDNKYNRAFVTDNLLKDNNINYIINLSNNDSNFNSIIKNNNSDISNNYTYSLYEENKIYMANLNIKYNSLEFAKDLSNALFNMTKNEGPFYIHCVHGRDRTGIACILLEALAGATYDEILEDYMLTYDNYYNINKYTNKDMYDVIIKSKFENALYYITKEEKINDFENYNYQIAAEKYLKYGGLTDEQIIILKDFITK